MIEVIDVSKSFDGFLALDGLSMTVPRGAVYGLVGPNGAGKSTIIRHLAGVYRQDAGEVLIDGVEVFETPAVKNRIAYISDELFFFNQASISDMMKYYSGVFPRFDVDRFSRLRQAFSLDEKMPMRRLSKGMQKQAAFWLAISSRPDLMILDEPVDGLDPVMRRQVWSLVMSDVAENETTILVSSHNLRELEDVCDHVGIMDSGKLLLERSLDELQSNIMKVQIAMAEGMSLPDSLEVIHESTMGRLSTLIVRGEREVVSAALSAVSPLFFDLMPLTLEEIFVYELEGANYAVKDILL
jgi:ABC-2 type transport system ATP-binding protein